jgi:hypothetical protein
VGSNNTEENLLKSKEFMAKPVGKKPPLLSASLECEVS